jgi:hypothetical protein
MNIHVQEHKEMLGLAAEILASSSHRPVPCGEVIAGLRLRFARLVNSHCSQEDTTIREGVRSGAVCPVLAAAMQRDLSNWRAMLTMFNSDWPGTRVVSDAVGFASGFHVLVDALRRHIAREETELLARIDHT